MNVVAVIVVYSYASLQWYYLRFWWITINVLCIENINLNDEKWLTKKFIWWKYHETSIKRNLFNSLLNNLNSVCYRCKCYLYILLSICFYYFYFWEWVGCNWWLRWVGASIYLLKNHLTSKLETFVEEFLACLYSCLLNSWSPWLT